MCIKQQLNVRINNIEEMIKAFYDYNVPVEIIKDVNQRITDWKSMGGADDAPYLTQQFKFVERYINSKKRKIK